MTITIKDIIPAKQAENVQTTQYTASLCRTVIDKFTATNTSANNVTLSVNIVASGSSPSDANLIIKSRIIAPGETYTFPALIGHVIENGCFISTLASAAASLTIKAAGREIT